MKKKLYWCIVLFLVSILIFTGCKKKNEEDTKPNNEKKPNNETIQGDNIIIEEPELEDDNDIAFSYTENFYSKSIEVEILSNKPGKIYYTTDGTDPSPEKKLYKTGIKLNADKELKVHNLKAKAYFEDGTESKTIVHTYFVGRNVDTRFDTLIFSVTTDPYNLYDYEYGIFIEGKLRADYIKANPWKKIDPPHPANFNMRGRESEREVFLEVFEPNGTRILGHNAGIRVYGGWSRANLQKSIKIFARKEYDEENNKLRYEFFPSKRAANGDGTILNSFKRLVLRNSGNDNGFAFIRDELFQTLAREAGYVDNQAVRPAALFVNGEYRGVFWMHEVYSDEYFKGNYGDFNGNFVRLEGGEKHKKVAEDESNLDAIREYEEIYNKYSKLDLTNDTDFQRLNELIDVKNYLEYYALQVYLGNEDWPHNNYKIYRYYTAEGEEYREAPFDGRWRYLLHDMDFTFGIYGQSPFANNIQNYVGKSGEIKDPSPLFGQLMRREDCREIFIKKTADLINGALAPDNISRVLDEMHAERLNEQMNMYGKNLLADWVRFDQLEERIEAIKTYGEQRAGFIIRKYQEFFGLGEIYQLSVQSAKGAQININSVIAEDTFVGSYYSDFNTVIVPNLPAGEEFDYWLVNGEKIYKEELIITQDRIKNGNVQVTLVLKEEPEHPQLIIFEVSSYKDEDYIILYNPYKVAVSMQGYTITDNRDKPDKLVLPTQTLAPGESLTILCESNSSALQQGQLRAEFNLKTGETLVLFQGNSVKDEIKIPKISEGNIYQRDIRTMRFFETPMN